MGIQRHNHKSTGVSFRHAEQRTLLREAWRGEERLRLSLEAAGLGYWDFDFRSGTLVWSEQARKLFGVEPTAPASMALLLSRVHPEDRPRLEEHIAHGAPPEADHVYHTEFRVVVQNGAIRWLDDQGRVEMNTEGMPVRAFGVIRDITARKNAEEAQSHLAAIVTSSADAIIGKTLDGIITTWNEAAERMFGYSASEMIGQSIRRLIPADRQAEEDMILARLAQIESIEHFETVRLAKDGQTFDASVTISPVRDVEGRIIGAAKIIRDITERKQMEQRLQLAAAQAIGLALHELATNAGKHGALSTDAGRVDIFWDGDGDTFTMSWNERDGPPVSAPQRRGFGTMVIEEMAARSLDGKVDLHYALRGVTWRLTCPAANAQERQEDR